MENKIKVGQSCEVAVITDNSEYPTLYNIGNCGVVVSTFLKGNIAVICGPRKPIGSKIVGWHVIKGTYKLVGKLTITKVK